MTARPFVKWPGGKRQLVSKILPLLPEEIGTYYEPFVGGGAVFFALASEGRFKKAVIGDANRELVETYTSLAEEADRVVSILSRHVYEEAYYYRIRALKPRSSAGRAARMIYLNRTGFNGLYRVNRKGEFNVPFGRYTNPTICDEENLAAVHRVLSRSSVKMLAGDFEENVKGATEGDAVYFDCPYWPVSKTADFTSFTKDGFTVDDQVRLRDCALRLKQEGVHVLLSNADVPPVRDLYGKRFKLRRVEARRAVNSNAKKRGSVGELLIS